MDCVVHVVRSVRVQKQTVGVKRRILRERDHVVIVGAVEPEAQVPAGEAGIVAKARHPLLQVRT